MSGHCRSCDTEIDWAVSDTTDRPMPVDHQPTDAGNLAVRRIEDGTLRARPCPPGAQLAPGEKRGMPHWATCPNADQHRKR